MTQTLKSLLMKKAAANLEGQKDEVDESEASLETRRSTRQSIQSKSTDSLKRSGEQIVLPDSKKPREENVLIYHPTDSSL